MNFKKLIVYYWIYNLPFFSGLGGKGGGRECMLELSHRFILKIPTILRYKKNLETLLSTWFRMLIHRYNYISKYSLNQFLESIKYVYISHSVLCNCGIAFYGFFSNLKRCRILHVPLLYIWQSSFVLHSDLSIIAFMDAFISTHISVSIYLPWTVAYSSCCTRGIFWRRLGDLFTL